MTGSQTHAVLCGSLQPCNLEFTEAFNEGPADLRNNILNSVCGRAGAQRWKEGLNRAMDEEG